MEYYSQHNQLGIACRISTSSVEFSSPYCYRVGILKISVMYSRFLVFLSRISWLNNLLYCVIALRRKSEYFGQKMYSWRPL